MDLNEAIIRLMYIQDKGYVKSLRNGPTGIGKTCETLLGITENNLSSPDLGEIELKSKRENMISMVYHNYFDTIFY